jgi:uncharacterized surface protein with fasciclin (FAS1) repeats
MKNYIIIIFSAFALVLGIISCEEEVLEAGFEDAEQQTIYDYVLENDSSFSSFLKVMEVSGIDKITSAYNPENIGFTLFLPTNQAMVKFIQNSDQFSSLDDMLNNKAYTTAFAKYHAVNIGIHTNDFPFGALPENTLSEDFLTVSFIIETDTSYYKINNEAPVVKPNVELSNGFIHVIENALTPITFTSYDWLAQHEGYSIFKEAVDLTGFNEIIDINLKDENVTSRPFTMFLEHDTVYSKFGINSLNDLIAAVSPNNSNYKDPDNPLNGYVGYHFVRETYFIDDFLEQNSNYDTYSEVPVNINGTGIDIVINKGKRMFDTIIQDQDTTFIDFIGIAYDISNITTQSGAIHFIDRMMQQELPTRAIQNFQFFEEPLFEEFRQELGSFIIEDTSALNRISYSGTDLFFVQEGDQSNAWGNDYLLMNGDFRIKYRIPKIVQGKYSVFLRAEAFNNENALVEVFIDGKNLGGLIDLGSGGNANNPFSMIELGSIDFLRYEEHTVEVRSLIPGRFLWDVIRFEPFSNN